MLWPLRQRFRGLLSHPRFNHVLSRRIVFNISRASRQYGDPVWHWLIDSLEAHQAIVGLALFVMLSNTVVAYAANDSPKISNATTLATPYQIAETVREIAPYIPNLNVDPNQLADTLDQQANGSYIAAPFMPITNASATGQPAAAQSETPPNPGKYVVQFGDTLSGISNRYNLHSVSVQVANHLESADDITAGQTLVIPSSDLSAAAIAAATTASEMPASAPSVKGTHTGGYGLIVPLHYTLVSRGVSADHAGIDFATPVGTPVAATKSGVVTIADSSGWNGGYGKTILINHGDGLASRYGHLSQVDVRVGEHVTQGEIIGYSGNTGRSTGPHLHFEVRINGRVIDPFGLSG